MNTLKLQVKQEFETALHKKKLSITKITKKRLYFSQTNLGRPIYIEREVFENWYWKGYINYLGKDNIEIIRG